MNVVTLLALTTAFLSDVGATLSTEEPLGTLAYNFLFNDSLSVKSEELPELINSLQYLIAPGLASNHSQCREDSEQFWNEIHNGYASKLWAMKMLNSAGSILPWGLVSKNTEPLGNFDQCLEVEWKRDKGGEKAYSKYCTVLIDLIKRDEFVNKYNASFTPLQREWVNASVYSKRAICVPESCSPEDVKEGTNKILNRLGLEAFVHHTTCTTKHGDKLTNGGKVMKFVLYVLIALLLGFTGFDLYLRRQKLLEEKKDDEVMTSSKDNNNELLTLLIDWFSLVKNMEKVNNFRKGSLDFVHGIRFFTRAWTTIGYGHSMVMQSPQRNADRVYFNFYRWHHNICLASTMGVDTFFFLSAFFTSLSFFKALKGNFNPNNVISVTLKSYLFRYLRLTPPYLFLIAMFSTVFIHLTDGPLWHEKVQHQVEDCQAHWWVNVLYINDIESFNPPGRCLNSMWFLSMDMLYFILAPFFLLPFLWKKNAGITWLLGLSLSALPISWTVAFHERSSLLKPILGQLTQDDFKIVTLRKICPYVCGLLCGYFYYDPPKRLNPTLVRLCWCVTPPLLSMVLFAGFQPLKLAITGLDTQFDYLTLSQRPIYSLILFWVVFACCHGYGGYVNSFLSWGAFIPFGKIMYSAYLVSYPVQMWMFYSRKETLYYDHAIMFFTCVTEVILIFAVGLLFYLCIECPLNGMTRHLMEKLMKPKQKEKTG